MFDGDSLVSTVKLNKNDGDDDNKKHDKKLLSLKVTHSVWQIQASCTSK